MSSGTQAGQFSDAEGGAYSESLRLVDRIDRSRLTATYLVADAIGTEYLVIEFLNRHTERSDTPLSWQADGEPTLEAFLSVAEHLSRLRHPNIEPILQVFEHNGTAYALVEPMFQRALSDDLEAGEFFHQPPEILSASVALSEAAQYLDAMGLHGLPIGADGVGMDDDARPVLSSRYAIEQLLAMEPLERTKPAAAERLAGCIYSMMTGNLLPSQRERGEGTIAGKADPYVDLSAVGLPYPGAALDTLSNALALGSEGMTQVRWAETFGKSAQRDVAVKARKRGRGLRRTFVAVTAVAAAAAGVVVLRPDLVPPSVIEILRDPGSAVSSTGLSSSTNDERGTPQAGIAASGNAETNFAVANTAQEAAKPINLEDAFRDLQGESDETVSAATPAETVVSLTPEPETSETAALEDKQETTVEAPASDQSASPRQPASTDDVFAVFRDLASQDEDAGTPDAAGSGNQSDQQPAETATAAAPAPIVPEEIAATDAGTPTTAADDQSAADTTVTASTNAAPEKPAAEASSLRMAVGTAIPVLAAEPGVAWTVDSGLAYSTATDGSGAYLADLRPEDQFAFITRNPWFARNTEIRSIAGGSVTEEVAVAELLARHFNAMAEPGIPVALTRRGSTAVEQAIMVLPIRAEQRLGDYTFAQESATGTWALVVRDAPAGAALTPGDTILGTASGSEINRLHDLRRVLDTASERGRTDITLKVRKASGRVNDISIRIGGF